MVLINIPQHKFEELLTRETELRDGSPEHTLDWYTYNNRIALLNEVKALQLKVEVPEETITQLKGDVKHVEQVVKDETHKSKKVKSSKPKVEDSSESKD